MAVWLVRAGTHGELSDHFREDACISIGYNLIDDLSDRTRWPDIRAAMYKYNSSATRPHLDQIWQFLWTIQAGDLIVTPACQGFTEVMVGRVSEGDPWFNDQAVLVSIHRHRRKVLWSTEAIELGDSIVEKHRLRYNRRTVSLICESELDFWMLVVAHASQGR